jgi:hypothetical protein
MGRMRIFNTNLPDTAQILQSSRGVLACALGGYKSEIVSDYDPAWFVNVHITMFPNGQGAKPQGMSDETYWDRLRWSYPHAQFGARMLGIEGMRARARGNFQLRRRTLLPAADPRSRWAARGLAIQLRIEVMA